MATESFFSNASLAYLASAGAGKDGKAYSIKPTTGAGDFTFSRGSNLAATRVGPTGLIEKGRENLVLQSNQFDTTWTTINSSVTSGQSGYDGSSDAWLLTALSTSNARVQQNKSFSGVHTYSVYAKSGTNDFLYIRSNGAITCGAYFDISNGTTSNSANLITESITSVGNGWYRCSITFNASSSTDVRAYVVDGFGSILVTSGSNIYIQDAQLEIGLAATDYIESGATTGKAGLLEDEPRFDYSGGATCPSLLLEPSRTQLAKYSEALNIAPNVIDNATYLYNEIASPSGLTDAPKFEETTANDRHGFYQYVIIADGAVTASVFTKQIDRRYIHFQSDATGSGQSSYVDLQDGSIVSEGTGWTLSAEDYGNGWWRISATATAVAGNRYFIWGMSLNGTTSTYVGDGSEFTFWGLQVEQASYPTSYIPNHSGGSVTRGEDFCNGALSVNDINSQEGVLYAEISALYDVGNFELISLNDGSNDNRCSIFFNAGTLSTSYRVNQSNIFLNVNGSVDLLQYHKVAISYKQNEFKAFIDGVKVAEQLSGNVAPANTFNELSFDRGGASSKFIGRTKQLLTFNTALTDQELIDLTTL